MKDHVLNFWWKIYILFFEIYGNIQFSNSRVANAQKNGIPFTTSFYIQKHENSKISQRWNIIHMMTWKVNIPKKFSLNVAIRRSVHHPQWQVEKYTKKVKIHSSAPVNKIGPNAAVPHLFTSYQVAGKQCQDSFSVLSRVWFTWLETVQTPLSRSVLRSLKSVSEEDVAKRCSEPPPAKLLLPS